MADAPTANQADVADIGEVMAMIPHRYPMLLVDKVTELRLDHSAVGIKNVTINEPQFQGHFPAAPIMPGVMIVEAMAQTAAVLVVSTLGPTARGKHVYFMSIDDCRFRRPVRPGDVMHIHIEKERSRGAVWRFAGRVLVDGSLAAEARFAAMIVDSA